MNLWLELDNCKGRDTPAWYYMVLLVISYMDLKIVSNDSAVFTVANVVCFAATTTQSALKFKVFVN